ncbi:hypothetical protein [Frankia sp. Cas4]|uniref:hypothetical protein n=1 Tax=Frankia sp. Cas4 TaxID=3073927 RepID=UPI002AD26941|nr:hypothetical protein [Frankia sp. Cas4]
MPDIVAAIDETAANVIVPRTISALPATSRSGMASLGPVSLSWSATGVLSGGIVDLIPPPVDVIRVGSLRVDYTLNLTLSLDLSFLNFCLPQVCVTIPFIGRVCTPRICITFPKISVPVSHSSSITAAMDLRLATTLNAGVWEVNAVIVGVPTLVLGPAATALLAAVGAAVTTALLVVPFIGPLLALASSIIFGTITLANILGLLGPIVTAFVAGLRVPIYQQPQMFEVLPPAPLDPAVLVRLDSVIAALDGSAGEDELVISVDISP